MWKNISYIYVFAPFVKEFSSRYLNKIIWVKWFDVYYSYTTFAFALQTYILNIKTSIFFKWQFLQACINCLKAFKAEFKELT